MKIELNGIKFDVVITKKRIKNIYFRVKEDLKIYVSCSYLCSDSYIEKLLIKNELDILKMYNNMKTKVSDNNDIYYLGEKLDFIEAKRVKIENYFLYLLSIFSFPYLCLQLYPIYLLLTRLPYQHQ